MNLDGRPLPRTEDARVLSGRSRFLDDIDPEGALHVAFVRSPHAHARITGIEVPESADGLALVLTAADVAKHARALPIQLSALWRFIGPSATAGASSSMGAQRDFFSSPYSADE